MINFQEFSKNFLSAEDTEFETIYKFILEISVRVYSGNFKKV